MKSLNLQGKQHRIKYKSYKGEVGKVAQNTLHRKFETNNAFEKLVTDLTEFNVCNEKAYLSPILDLYNNEILSYYSFFVSAFIDYANISLYIKIFSTNIK